MPKKARCHWSEDEQMPERTSMNQQARRSGGYGTARQRRYRIVRECDRRREGATSRDEAVPQSAYGSHFIRRVGQADKRVREGESAELLQLHGINFPCHRAEA